MTESDKFMLYESKMKSPIAAVYSAFLSSADHAYAGNWGRGLLFTAEKVGIAILIITTGIDENTNTLPREGYSYQVITTEVNKCFT